MKRVSNYADYRSRGEIIVDADGIHAQLGTYRGIGSPEGKIAAQPGSVYIDRVGTTGATQWIKVAGVGATGWRVQSGDTGWRDITSLLSTPPTSGSVWIRRTPGFVLLRLLYLSQSDGASTSISLPTGFSPGVRTAGALFSGSGSQAGRYTLSFGGALTLHTTTGTLDCALSIAVEPGRPWPSTYIGTPT